MTDKLRLLLSMSAAEIELDPVYAELLTPEEFIEVYQTRQNEIRRVRLIPARLGEPGFGKILVRWKTPIYSARTLKRYNDARSSRRSKER